MASRILVTVFLLSFASCLYGQDKPVVKWADDTSYATAAVSPTVGVIQAWQSNNRKCNFLKLGLKELIGNGTALTIKHYISSPRPCLGCGADGMPSGHTDNAFIGPWQFSIAFGAGTGILRHVANRHTWTQVIAGAGVGVASDLLGNLIHCN